MSEALAETLAKAITLGGPISIARYMGAANAHYYATCDPFGTSGDFITAPDISQMFGELVGAWMADLWIRAERPSVHYVELGPGRGTLACDALRVMARSGLSPAVHFVETSPTLRQIQRQRVPQAQFHDSADDLPGEGALMIVANEFFDALPIHQMIKTTVDWRERRIAYQQGLFIPVAERAVPDGLVPASLHKAAPGSIIESCPSAVGITEALARRLTGQGGALLVIDYGYDGPAIGDTLQAVKRHGFVNPFEAPGERDLSAHVDFATLGNAARRAGASVAGPITQGAWLGALGIGSRAAALVENHPERRNEVTQAVERLTSIQGMGSLFRVLAVTAPLWPDPSGF